MFGRKTLEFMLICIGDEMRDSLINSSWRGLTQSSSDSRQQAASRRLSSSSSLCQPSGLRHQGSMCWISIHATTLMLMCSRITLDNTYDLWSWYCVLPQVAWWGKGCWYVFVVTLAVLWTHFTNDADSFASVSYHARSCGFEVHVNEKLMATISITWILF